MIEAAIFDLDGLLIDSEEVWDAVREEYVGEHGRPYTAEVQRAMMGMSSAEWSRYLHESVGISDEPAVINDEIVRRMQVAYAQHLPLVAGAVEAVQRVATRFPLALASSSNRPLIDEVLELSGLAPSFRATVSSEEVGRGKPAPDVYLEAANRLGFVPDRCAAIEDSHAGIRSAHAAGMRVIVVPNASYPPGDDALALADVLLASLEELTPEVVAGSA